MPFISCLTWHIPCFQNTTADSLCFSFLDFQKLLQKMALILVPPSSAMNTLHLNRCLAAGFHIRSALTSFSCKVPKHFLKATDFLSALHLWQWLGTKHSVYSHWIKLCLNDGVFYSCEPERMYVTLKRKATITSLPSLTQCIKLSFLNLYLSLSTSIFQRYVTLYQWIHSDVHRRKTAG